MPTPRALIVLLVTLLLAGASIVAAQQQQRFQPFPGYGNICNTQWGWCPLHPNVMIVVGAQCQCQAYNGQILSGQAHQFPYQNYNRPVSPYLNPHWTDPPPPPPVIK
jgi:hypothetical protein